MKCPFCRQPTTEVFNTRATSRGSQIWRRRRCETCAEAFTTYESPVLAWLTVQGASGRPAAYNRARLYASISAAFPPHFSRAVTTDALTDTVESKLLDLRTRTLTTQQISTTILVTLKAYDAAAFVRYLTAHADVTSNAQLKRELRKY
jgi:transcriptional repressor NrdR